MVGLATYVTSHVANMTQDITRHLVTRHVTNVTYKPGVTASPVRGAAVCRSRMVALATYVTNQYRRFVIRHIANVTYNYLGFDSSCWCVQTRNGTLHLVMLRT